MFWVTWNLLMLNLLNTSVPVSKEMRWYVSQTFTSFCE